ncbi:uncharacterized protein TNCV_82211 [Trichonephila clavipes]|nr:uncharacterized protein TNCV_82211 [Trichonephila clavipes]
MRKQHKNWEKYYNRKRREVSIKVNDLVLVQTHFISAAGRRMVGKEMPKFEGPYRVLEVRNYNLIIWKRGKSVTVNIDQVCECTVHDNPTRLVRTVMLRHYMKDRGPVIGQVDRLGKFKGSRKTSSEESNGSKSNKGNTGWEDPRLKRKVESNGSGNRKDLKRSKMCKKTFPSIAGPSHPRDSRQDKPPTKGSRHEGSGQYNKARETRTTKNGTNRAAERRPVRSKQATAVIPCPYYLRSRVRQPEGFPKERRNSGIESIPQNNIRRRSLSMEALDGDPVDKSE